MKIKNNKDKIITEILDNFIERKREGKQLTIDEYINKYPEYAEEIKNAINEESFWLSAFNIFKNHSDIVSTDEELQRGWEKVLNRIKVPIWIKVNESFRKLTTEIKVGVSKLGIPKNLQNLFSFKTISAPVMLGDSKTKKIEEIEIPIEEIDGLLKISLYPSDPEGYINIRVQPEIEKANPQDLIHVILWNRKHAMMVEGQFIHSGEKTKLSVSLRESYSIRIELKGKTYEVPLKF